MSSFLVIAPQGLGDALEATPILAALKAAEPAATIDVAVLRPGPKRLFDELTGHVDRVLYYPYWHGGALAFAGSVLKAMPGMRRYDVSVLAYPAARPEYHALARLHRATKRIAHEYWPMRRSNLQWLHNVLVPVRDVHNVERNLDLVRSLGIVPDANATYVVPKSWIGDRRAHDKTIAIHIGTVTHHGLANKRWPADRFGEVARRLVRDGYDVRIIAGPDERADSQRIIESAPGAELVEGELDEIARFLSGCTAALTNDSGIGHLAAAVGTKVLALHGPTPIEGGPYGARAERFRPSLCPPCFDPRLRNTNCALDIDFACLKRDMTVDQVESALRELVSRA
jgi:ADP-heptose:LPS heptosyltransferase